ncbi:hypothetical protein [Nodosilinea nodulosa]|uniref:hypothetical protein n=1 Tax=Nodosilinea nodulosa TaxID=416001 RepID=UPI0002E8A195|nr:hypothetical protein [Nodosilinea nodulosa]
MASLTVFLQFFRVGNMHFYIHSKKIFQFIGIAVLTLTGLGAWNYFVGQSVGDFFLKESLMRLTDLDDETSFSTWFSTLLLLFCAFLMMIIALVKRSLKEGYVSHWWGLSTIFLLLSIDEASQIHEIASGLSGVLGMAEQEGRILWVVPYILFVLAVAGIYAKFLWSLPGHIRNLFCLAGAIYVGGAIGLEMLGFFLPSDVYLFILIEEFMEMAGIAILAYALLIYLNGYITDIQVHLRQ